jgi:hypothetical protein
MTSAATHYRREAEVIERNRSACPNALRVADLVQRLADSPAFTGHREALLSVVWTVEAWANLGREVNADEALVVLEAAFKLGGIR